jgi:archaellum biogenesis protein FlaJ (TadC family)
MRLLSSKSKTIGLFTTFIALILIIPPRAHAIIFLPALILIPIAKIIALIIGGFTLPALSLGALWSKLTKHSLKRTLLLIFLCLLTLSLAIGTVLKLANPNRPIF